MLYKLATLALLLQTYSGVTARQGVTATGAVVPPASNVSLRQPAQETDNSGTGSSSFTYTFPTPVPAGDFIVVPLTSSALATIGITTDGGASLTECTACAAAAGDRYAGRTFSILATSTVSSLTISNGGVMYAWVYDAQNYHGYDSALSVSSNFGTYTSVSAPFTTTHANALALIAVADSGSSATTGVTGASWTPYSTTPLSYGSFANNFSYTATIPTAGSYSFSKSFPSDSIRPTVSGMVIY